MINYLLVGGKIPVKSIKGILANGYNHDKEYVDDYILDKELSGQRAQVYVNKNNNQVVINHRGTQGSSDILTDLGLLYNNKSNKRFNHSKKVTQDAKKKYGNDYKYVQMGHSLGSALAKEANKDNDELIGVNPAVTEISKQKPNETIIRSSYDPISILHSLNPFASKTKTINIPAKSLNLVDEHKVNVLDRLDPELQIGGNIKNYKITKYSKDKAKELGVKIKLSKNKNKKIDVYDTNNNFIASIGDIKYSDYPTYIKSHGLEYANKRQRLYKQRHEKDLNNKGSAGYYSFNILW